MFWMQRLTAAVLLTVTCLLLKGSAEAQVPQPFPRPRDPQAPARPAPTAPAAPAPAPPAAATPAAPEPAPAADGAPTEATLGFPIYPNAQFIASYDAGKNQRYYLFG